MEPDSKSASVERMAAPPVVPRPHLAFWLWVRGIDWKQAGELLEMHAETARCYCLEFGNPVRRVPRSEPMQRILALTEGEVVEADFHRPRDYQPDAFRLRPAYQVPVDGVTDDPANEGGDPGAGPRRTFASGGPRP